MEEMGTMMQKWGMVNAEEGNSGGYEQHPSAAGTISSNNNVMYPKPNNDAPGHQSH